MKLVTVRNNYCLFQIPHSPLEILESCYSYTNIELIGVSDEEVHAICNFMINTGEATAADLESLGDTVRADVMAKTGVQLDWDIKRIGRKA